jgi:hypothetical protein
MSGLDAGVDDDGLPFTADQRGHRCVTSGHVIGSVCRLLQIDEPIEDVPGDIVDVGLRLLQAQ